ncbi:MAG: hypothetical protein M1838_002131 [Thelocarpon superellum]|nr:MAG: hypothetical protein M1838_002131 [Thelocarpon superellum]
MSTDPPPSLPPKFSRYRSVRNVAPIHVAPSAPSSPPSPPSSPPYATTVEPVSRSMSRYRRTRPKQSDPAPEPLPPVASHTGSRTVESVVHTPPGSREDAHGPPHTLRLAADASSLPHSDGRVFSGPTTKRDPVSSDVPPRQEAGIEGSARKVRLQEVDARPRDEQDGGEALQKDRFKLFSRRKAKDDPTPTSFTSPSSQAHAHARPKDEQPGIEPGGGGIVPGTDAPISAVNAGERRVKIKCGETYINLPVNPDTTPIDLLHAATVRLQKPTVPDASKLVESFTPLGLERPLRQYEKVRDVMNSWDRDSQNGLILLPTEAEAQDRALEAAQVPQDRPGEISAYLHYSRQPGKWEKRWATLRPDGQMFVAKKADAKDKDVTNICHLSDFDIYTPTRRQAKALKAPKKYCLAVKSQQRSSMFLSAANYVHFFAADDQSLAAQWYTAVQGWRSWYLVNRVGVVDRPSTATTEPARTNSSHGQESLHVARRSIQGEIAQNGRPSASRRTSGQGHAPATGDAGVPRSRAASDANPHGAQHEVAHHRPPRERRAPPISFPKKLTKAHSEGSRPETSDGEHLIHAIAPPAGEATFAPNSLLGRTYSQRQETLYQREMTAKEEGPFIDGPSLLRNSSLAQRDRSSTHSSHRSAVDSPAVHTIGSTPSRYQPTPSRTPSQPRPLVDLSGAEHRELPHHQKKGRGYVVDHVPPGGLVDAATAASDSPNSSRINSLTRTRSAAQDPFLDPQQADRESQMFTGLLARAGTSQGGSGRGRGVKTGHRDATEPLLDLTEVSQFAPGSLLSRAQSDAAGHGPVIDRESRDEILVQTGEGA